MIYIYDAVSIKIISWYFMEVDELIKRLSDIDCGGKGTSCPDQLAKALKEHA